MSQYKIRSHESAAARYVWFLVNNIAAQSVNCTDFHPGVDLSTLKPTPSDSRHPLVEERNQTAANHSASRHREPSTRLTRANWG